MTASEKLKALVELNFSAAAIEVIRVLPQIVAVIAAAERTVLNAQLVADEEIELARALRDLEEVLP